MASAASKGPPQAFQDAFDRLKDSVTEDDARIFQSTTLQDVRNAALDLENQLGLRQSLRNMRRILPFLSGLERYSKSIEILCNGTPYLPWIWAPVKLVLQLASDYVEAFDRLIAAYQQIAENLPRFDRLAAALKDSPDFQKVLGVFYADILEFHRRSYKFVRRRGWTFFFKSSWARFDTRFKGILADLARHSELVDKEATSFAIVQATDWRTRWLEESAKQEDERSNSQFKDVLSWLEASKSEQEDELDTLVNVCHPGSCQWVFENAKIKSWIRKGPDHAVLWLKGKPGSGKTVLCSKIISALQEDKDNVVLYYFCKYYSTVSRGANHCGVLLRSLATQILRRDRDLAPLVFDDYISQGLLPSVAQMRKILTTLISGFTSVRIIVDGVDEYDEGDQKIILTEIASLAVCKSAKTCKVMISSQDVIQISKSLSRRSVVSLSDEHGALDTAIQGFVHSSFSTMTNLDDMSIEEDSLTSIEEALVGKANGMFLWVYLVLATLENVYSKADMRKAVDELPEGLDEVYKRILDKMQDQLNAQSKIAIRILQWIACVERPLKKYEVQDGVVLHEDNTVIDDSTKVSKHVFDLCKPLLEDGPAETIRFIHSSVKQYLLKPKNPFLDSSKSQYDITFACVSYLKAGLSLIDPLNPKEDRLANVAKGFHGLHLFASENWTEHLLIYIDSRKETGGFDDSGLLLEQLAQLCAKHAAIEESLNPESKNGKIPLPDIQHPRMQRLQPYEDVHSLVWRHEAFQKAIKIAQRENGLEADDALATKDPTLFTLAQSQYQDLTRQVLAADSIPGVPDSTLSNFKLLYGSTAFLCRFRGCRRTTHGFESEHDLLEHETTHTMELLCPQETCEYSKIGFRSPRALKRHIQEFHPEPGPEAIPDSLLRADTEATLVGGDGGEILDEDELLNEFVDLDVPVEIEPQRYEPRFYREDGFAMSTARWEEDE